MQEEYFRLYCSTVEAIKRVDSRLRVGGPATSNFEKGKAPWVEEFLAYCASNDIPVDFVSTHPYPNNWPMDSAGQQLMTCRYENSTYDDTRWLRDTIGRSAFPDAEIHLTEWNSSPSPRDLVHDTAFMAPFIIQNNLRCIGLTDSLVFWTFTDVFEENRVGDIMFHGGFRLINLQDLPKASFYGYWFLSKLGEERIITGENYVVTRNDDRIQILMWNYCHYNGRFAHGDRSGLTEYNRYSVFEDKGSIDFDVTVTGFVGNYKITEYMFDRGHGSAFDAWVDLGAPPDPTEGELEFIRRKTGPEYKIAFLEGQETFRKVVTVQPHGVSLIELQKLY